MDTYTNQLLLILNRLKRTGNISGDIIKYEILPLLTTRCHLCKKKSFHTYKHINELDTYQLCLNCYVEHKDYLTHFLK